MRIVETVCFNKAEVEVHFDTDNMEYICKLFKLTPCTRTYCKNADYFTESRDDARRTAHAMALHVQMQGD